MSTTLTPSDPTGPADSGGLTDAVATAESDIGTVSNEDLFSSATGDSGGAGGSGDSSGGGGGPVASRWTSTPFLRGLGHIVRSPTLLIAILVLGTVIAWALWPQLFTRFDPLEGDAQASFAPPSWEHLFGTDRLGRDLFSRAVYGSSTTLTSTLLAVALGFVIGSAIGLVSGFIGGRTDTIVMRFVDVLLAIPGLLLAMAVVAALGYGTANVAIAVGIAAIAAFARVMRSEVLKVVQSEYVEAAAVLGSRPIRVLVRHVLPNSLSAVLSLAALEFGSAVLAVASLGFLGYGAPPPQPEWGLAVSEGRDFLAVYPWVSLLPGLVIAAVVLSTNRISQAIGVRR